MRYLILILFFVPLWVYPPHVFADTPVAQAYIVSGSEKFTQSSYPHLLSSLTVPVGTSLKIEAGVKLTFTAGALFLINGTLTAAGTEKEPIILQGQNAALWSGVYATSNTVAFTQLTITNAQTALIATKGGTKFEHLLLEDNMENVIVLGQVGFTHSMSYDINNITFQNRLLGSAMGNEGLIVQGNDPIINFHNNLFEDIRVSVSGGVLGVLIEGEGLSFVQSAIQHSRGCKFGQKFSLDGSTYQLGFNSDSCNVHVIPVVFIPGYGTSINLPQLVQGNPTPTLEGWRFLQGITPAYTTFLQTLKVNNIPTTIAYYDWRLPAQTIVTQYLLPAIAAAKAETGSSVVHLVAHSFGGLVAREYIQSDSYQGDVVSLTEIGTPNLGTAKAYSVWEAGQLPSDWQAVSALVRWYQYQESDENLSDQELIQKYFPSVQQLLPIYPAIIRLGTQLLSSNLYYQNTLAQSLLATQESLLKRVAVETITSQSEPTVSTINVGPLQRSKLWRDGMPLDQQPTLTNGDGTVPLQSALIDGAENIATTGLHADLPENAAQTIIQNLYPFQSYQSPPTPNPLTRSSKDMLWFFFDCPVTVKITLPDGTTRSSTDADDDTNTEVGNVAVTPEMTWMLMPSEIGDYTVAITALQNTTVRSWVNMNDPVTFTLSANQTEEWHPFAIVTPEISPTPSPSAALTVSTAVTPSPASTSLADVDTTFFTQLLHPFIPTVLFVPQSGVLIPWKIFPVLSWYIRSWKSPPETYFYQSFFTYTFFVGIVITFLHRRKKVRKQFLNGQHLKQ